MKVKIGELNKRIEIGHIKVITDYEGFDKKIFETDYKCWAKINNISGTEIIKNGVDFSKVKTRFLIRYKEGINTNMQIKFNKKLYNIIYINDYNYSNRFMEIIGEIIE